MCHLQPTKVGATKWSWSPGNTLISVPPTGILLLHLQHDPDTNTTVVVPSLLRDNTTRTIINMPTLLPYVPPGYQAGAKV